MPTAILVITARSSLTPSQAFCCSQSGPTRLLRSRRIPDRRAVQDDGFVRGPLRFSIVHSPRLVSVMCLVDAQNRTSENRPKNHLSGNPTYQELECDDQ